MNQKLLALCFGLTMPGAVTWLFAEVPIQRPLEAARAETVNFVPNGTIRLDDSFGDLYIEGWDRPSVEITLVKEMQDYNAPKDASQRLERVGLAIEHPSANELKISTTIPSHSFFRHPFGGKGDVSVRYELHVPRDSRLVIHHGGGNILISDVTGGIEASNREGDIVLMLPGPGPYSIDARSKMGTVTSEFAGKGHVRHFIGESFSGARESDPHSINLRVGFGGISIKEMAPESRTN